MKQYLRLTILLAFSGLLTLTTVRAQRSASAPLNLPDSSEVDYEIKNFPFESGDTTLPVLRLHYTTFGHDQQPMAIAAPCSHS